MLQAVFPGEQKGNPGNSAHFLRLGPKSRKSCARSGYAAAEGADALFLVTEWNEFRRPDLKRPKGVMKTPVIFDGRNVFDPAQLREEGFTYYGIGRP